MHTISPDFLFTIRHTIVMQIPEANARITAPLPTPTAIKIYPRCHCVSGVVVVGDGRRNLVDGVGEEEGTGQSSMW